MLTAYFVAIASATIGQTSTLTHVGTLTQDLQYPGRVALIPGGGVYVTDQPSGTVVEFDGSDTYVATHSVPELPVGIAVAAGGTVYVSRLDGQVGVYDAAFDLQSTLDPGLVVPMSGPNGMAIDDIAGEIYVVDSLEHQVLVFDMVTGTLARAWGAQGSGLGEFQSPQSVALDAALGHVIVTDTDNFRLQVFDTNGLLQYKFGYRTLYVGSTQVAWFARSEGVAVDGCSNIYVADALMGTIRAFDAVGGELDLGFVPMAEYGPSPDGLRIPIDLATDGTTLYVSSNYNAAVEVYDLSCTAPLLPLVTPRPNLNLSDAALADIRKSRNTTRLHYPDNPFDIVHAMASGEYDASLDVNGDRQVDMTDLELTVEHFGGATVEDFLPSVLADTYAGPMEAPHMIDIPNACGRCHSMDGLPGGMLSGAGQENLCLSCHTAGGVAMHKPISSIDKGNSHPRGIPADQGISMGPDPDGISEMALHLDNGDIRCGTCHEPMTSEDGAPYLRATIGDASLCGECHTQGAEWAVAGHSDGDSTAFNYPVGPGRESCATCHSGLGYIDFSEGVAQADLRTDKQVHSCVVCHGVHENGNVDLLRVADEVELPGGYAVTNAGASATCMVCHNGRYEPGPSHLTPHYALGAVMLEGINGIDFGATLSNSPHTAFASCTVCHMAAGPADGDPGAGKVGGHTFNMTVHDPGASDDGFENVDNSCNTAACHGNTGALTEFNRTAYGDFDGNGSVDGVQDEVQGLLNLVIAEIEGLGAVFLGGYPYWSLPKVCIGGIDDGLACTANTDCDDALEGDEGGTCGAGPNDAVLRDAIWNYEYVDNDGSLGVHNTDYAVGLLQVTFEALTGNAIPDAELVYTPPGFGETVVVITEVIGSSPVEPGEAFSVIFTIEDEFGNPVAIGDLDRLRLYVSGPTDNYQRVIYSDSDPSHFVQNGSMTYTYSGDPFPLVYLAPLNDSGDLTDYELTGDALLDGTYTVLIESRRTFGSIRKAGDATFDFVVANDPGNPPALAPRQFVTQENCNACHLDLQIHGGNRFAVTGCVVCHTYGAEDKISGSAPTPGVTIQFGNMIHMIHSGHALRNVEATENSADPYRYEIIGYGSSVHDFSDVGFPRIPAAVTDCDACHEGAAQGAEIYTNHSRMDCGGCHDDLDFTTGSILNQDVPEICLGGLYDDATCTGDSDCEEEGACSDTDGVCEDDSDCPGTAGACSITAATPCVANGDCPEFETCVGYVAETCVGFVAGTCGPDPALRFAGLGTLEATDLDDPAYRVVLGSGNLVHTWADGDCGTCHDFGAIAAVDAIHRHSTDPAVEGTELAVEIISVGGMTGGGGAYFLPGDTPEVTFKLVDNANDPLWIPSSPDLSVIDRLYFMVVGPTTLYQQIIPDERAVNSGNVSADPANWTDHGNGTYTYTMVGAFPVNYPAQENALGQAPADQIFPFAGGWGQQYTAAGTPLDNGTYSVMVWGRRVTPSGDREPALTDILDVPFGAAVPNVPWPATVTSEKCNDCHGVMAFHGNQREGVQLCAGCHTAGGQNRNTYQGIGLRLMIHKLHNAQNLTKQPYELNGHGGLVDFSHLLISSMPGGAAECAACHATDDWKAPPVRSNMRTWMAACTSCHDSDETMTHADAMTIPGTFVEMCTFCHGDGAPFSVESVHAAP